MKYLLINDSGHNEYVAGKQSPDGSLKEYIFNDDMQYRLKKRAEEHGIDVYLTNPNPKGKDEIGLSKRAQLANDYWVKCGKPKTLFCSIHANAYPTSGPRGVEVFHAKNASTNSKNAAKYLDEEIFKTVKAIDSNFIDRGVKSENFTVIYKSNMPSVLIEYAFYSNPKDLIILKNNKDELVEATVKGICKYFGIAYKSPVTVKNGWIKFEDGWSYYINDIWQTGWILDNNKWYYINEKGYMVTGWLNEKDKWYYLNSDGSMATGWINVDGKDYYLNSNGEMQTDHIDLDGICYHFSSSGELVKSTDL